LSAVVALDRAERGFRLVQEVARYLALGMAYEDVIRVADLKTRSARFARVREEAQCNDEQVLLVEEFMHPRVEELCDVMPARIGAWCLNTPAVRKFIGVFLTKGRRVKTTSLQGFLLLYLLAGLRRFRRMTLRYRTETAELDAWMATVKELAAVNYDLAVEVAECRRLVKGYGDTHKRGSANFQRIIAALAKIKTKPDAAARIKRMRETALAEADGEVVEQAVRVAV